MSLSCIKARRSYQPMSLLCTARVDNSIAARKVTRQAGAGSMNCGQTSPTVLVFASRSRPKAGGRRGPIAPDRLRHGEL